MGKTSAILALSLETVTSSARAQVIDELQADIPFAFTVGDTTLPPGNYTLKMVPNTDLNEMQIVRAGEKTSFPP